MEKVKRNPWSHQEEVQRVRRKTERTERGAVLVELAFVVIPLLLLSLGVADIGFAWRDAVVTQQAARAASRVLVVAGDDESADRQALLSAITILGTDQIDDIEYIAIYDADNNGFPAACATSSTATCNRYTPAELRSLDDTARWGCGSGAYDSSWCPDRRTSNLEVPGHVGVQIKTNRGWVTGLLPGAVDISGSTVMRLDPMGA